MSSFVGESSPTGSIVRSGELGITLGVAPGLGVSGSAGKLSAREFSTLLRLTLTRLFVAFVLLLFVLTTSFRLSLDAGFFFFVGDSDRIGSWVSDFSIYVYGLSSGKVIGPSSTRATGDF